MNYSHPIAAEGLRDAYRSQGGRISVLLYSLEGSEPSHIHVEHSDNVAKYWLEPAQLASSYGFCSQELGRLRLLAIEHRIEFQEAWNAHFGS